MNKQQQNIIGSLIGTAVGDALGLPYEGLSRNRGAKMLGRPDRYRLLFGHGMVSDDTEHACMTAQALVNSAGDVELFRKLLARQLRYWLLALPAGAGLATLRAIVRLWMGFDAKNSGVFSAGNGAAMRAPIIGVVADDLQTLRVLVSASTRITHSDKKAEFGALAAALAAHMASRQKHVSAEDFQARLTEMLDGEAEEFLALMAKTTQSVVQGHDTLAFAESLGLGQGVSGYTYHTIPVAIHAWLTHQDDFRAAVVVVIQCGGDTDSTAAIVGGIVGASTGKDVIPAEWVSGLFEWPRSVSWMERLGMALGADVLGCLKPVAISPSFFAILLRNLFFLIVVLFHGFRRLLPPY